MCLAVAARKDGLATVAVLFEDRTVRHRLCSPADVGTPHVRRAAYRSRNTGEFYISKASSIAHVPAMDVVEVARCRYCLCLSYPRRVLF